MLKTEFYSDKKKSKTFSIDSANWEWIFVTQTKTNFNPKSNSD
ncbi:hypothetical protein C943_03166 [Mariniradius saccharolyticus AK6]|uniref:Uncharacterized protein n=1 Tax=Mariniradius saccharolyticus AK6 TaxID=1239962 RepID=M7XBQ6_9BACT|nr:hypothetical protein C943_03166 [Mariniradius saccharolyticus AK6]